MDIGEIIKRRRTRLGLTQTTAAVKAGVSTSTWQDYEYDTDRPRHPTTKQKIALALDWPADAFDRIREGADPDDLASTASSADIGGLQDRLDQMLNGFDRLNGNVDALVGLHQQLDARVRLTETGLGEVLTRTDRHDATLREVLTRLGQAEQRVDALSA